MLTNQNAKGVLGPLLKLRQACSHFQVGSNAHSSLKKTTMTLEELHMSLMDEEKEKIEEQRRISVMNLHGAAGILLLPSRAHKHLSVGDVPEHILTMVADSSRLMGSPMTHGRTIRESQTLEYNQAGLYRRMGIVHPAAASIVSPWDEEAARREVTDSNAALDSKLDPKPSSNLDATYAS